MAEIKPYELETERLILRQWRQSDFDDFARMSADPAVMRYFPSTLNRKESDHLAQRIQTLINSNGWGFWALEHKDDQDFLGFTGLHHCKDNLPFTPAVEIGWRLKSGAWGKGYATEAATRAMRFAFEELQLDQIVAFTAELNLPSQAVMQRLGMQREPETFEHPEIEPTSTLSTHVLYTRACFI